jgi:hypothetical protein
MSATPHNIGGLLKETYARATKTVKRYWDCRLTFKFRTLLEATTSYETSVLYTAQYSCCNLDQLSMYISNPLFCWIFATSATFDGYGQTVI